MLCQDLLFVVFDYLRIKDIYNCRLVCKSFHMIAQYHIRNKLKEHINMILKLEKNNSVASNFLEIINNHQYIRISEFILLDFVNDEQSTYLQIYISSGIDKNITKIFKLLNDYQYGCSFICPSYYGIKFEEIYFKNNNLYLEYPDDIFNKICKIDDQLYLKRIIKSDFFEIKKYFSKGYTILLNKNNLKNVWNHSYEYNDYIELYLPNIFIKLYKYNSDNNYVYFKYSNDIYEGYEFSNEYEYIMASMIR